MKTKLYICAAILLVAVLLAAGCTQSQTTQAGAASPPAGQSTPMSTPQSMPQSSGPQASQAPTATMMAASSTPGPVDTLPNAYQVDVSVASNGKATNPQIIMTFNGGNGMGVVPEIDFQVTRSDGVVENDKLTQPLSTGETLSLAGTTGNTDRAQVWVITPSGDRVLVVDQYVPFRQY